MAARRRPFTGILFILLTLLAIVCFFPFYIMIINSTQTNAVLSQQLALVPGGEFINNYLRMNELVHIWTGFKNSLIIAVSATALSGYFGALTAYGFAKFKFKLSKPLFAVVLSSIIVPPQLAIVGFYDICNKLHLVNSFGSLIIPAIANASLVFFVRYYIQDAVPDSVLESARLDGCGELKIFNRIVLPMIIPSIATMSIFTFVNLWNSYLIPLFMLSDDDKYTVPIKVALAKGVYQNDYGAVYSGIALSIIPIMIVFSFCSKYIIGGLTAGAVKG